MIKLIQAGLVAFAMALGCGETWAQWVSAQQLQEYCDAEEGVFYGVCSGYISAVADMQHFPLVMNGRKLCTPPGVDRSQLVEVVKKYLREHPEQYHFPGSFIVFEALTEAWPNACD